MFPALAEGRYLFTAGRHWDSTQAKAPWTAIICLVPSSIISALGSKWSNQWDIPIFLLHNKNAVKRQTLDGKFDKTLNIWMLRLIISGGGTHSLLLLTLFSREWWCCVLLWCVKCHILSCEPEIPFHIYHVPNVCKFCMYTSSWICGWFFGQFHLLINVNWWLMTLYFILVICVVVHYLYGLLASFCGRAFNFSSSKVFYFKR